MLLRWLAAIPGFACYCEGWSPLEQNLFEAKDLDYLKNGVKESFFHAWSSYIGFAMPADEVRPLTCEPLGPDQDTTHVQKNDVLGNYSVTLVDSVDMLAIVGEDELFRNAVAYIDSHVSFDTPSIVQVFEATIRGMGGLLSAHLLASVPSLGHAIPGYDGHLLEKAYDLGLRLLPAFKTKTGIPWPRVHLQKGIVKIGDKYVSDTCSAGAGSLLLEFTMLSRLTGDERFETLAKNAFHAIWDRRSDIGLVGMHLDALTGKWLDVYTGNGASVDSIYEYALKQYVLFGDTEFKDIWDQMLGALSRYSSSGWLYRVVNFQTGSLFVDWIDALAAFWPGLLVLAGKVSHAIPVYLTYFKLWNTYAAIPERWSPVANQNEAVSLEWYLLRPEFIESTYFLYRATKDPLFLQVGEAILGDINDNNYAQCGYAGFQDVRTGEINNRMESFFLSETLKYLFLLFDTENPLNKDETVVFTTEAHPFWYSEDVVNHAQAANFQRVLDKLRTTDQRQYSRRPKREWKRGFLEQKSNPVQYPVPPDSASCINMGGAQMGSFVASWDYFYFADSMVDFKRPAWLQRDEDIEFANGFYEKYVSSHAVCRAFY